MDILKDLKITDLQIIGQSADLSIIFAYHLTRRRIICFDQHAAHERIRYEKLLEKLQNKSSDDAIKSKACHGAIRIGTKLTLKQCHTIVRRLLICKVPFRCAHFRCAVSVLESVDKIVWSRKLREKS